MEAAVETQAPMIVEAVSTLGFPIACVIGLCWFIYKIYQDSVKREAALMTEIKETRAVNAKALETIAHYAEELGVIRTDISDIKSDITVIMAKQEGI